MSLDDQMVTFLAVNGAINYPGIETGAGPDTDIVYADLEPYNIFNPQADYQLILSEFGSIGCSNHDGLSSHNLHTVYCAYQ